MAGCSWQRVRSSARRPSTGKQELSKGAVDKVRGLYESDNRGVHEYADLSLVRHGNAGGCTHQKWESSTTL